MYPMAAHALLDSYYFGNSEEDTHEVELARGSQEYNDAVSYANNEMKKNITMVTKVHAPTLYRWFLLRVAEYKSRGLRNCSRTLLHVTAAQNIGSILKENLDWRRVWRGRYGLGISFADTADYAQEWARRSIGDKRAMIVADVLVGKTTDGSYCCEIPPQGVDTTIGNNHVYVKFYDDEFYPKYVIYYKNY